MRRVRLNESQLRTVIRRIVKEQSEFGGQVKLRSDIDSEFLGGGPFKKGQDVTSFFADDIAQPVKAIILNPFGPGGGNPEVLLTFMDEDHAWEWWNTNLFDGDGDPQEFEMALGKGSRGM